MKNGVCPKCSSEEVYFDGSGRNGVQITISMMLVKPTHTYVCADCGYLEFYAQTGFDLSRVKEKFQKVKK